MDSRERGGHRRDERPNKVDHEQEPLSRIATGRGRQERREQRRRKHLRPDEEGDPLRSSRAVRENAECDGNDRVAGERPGPGDLDSTEGRVSPDGRERR